MENLTDAQYLEAFIRRMENLTDAQYLEAVLGPHIMGLHVSVIFCGETHISFKDIKSKPGACFRTSRSRIGGKSTKNR